MPRNHDWFNLVHFGFSLVQFSLVQFVQFVVIYSIHFDSIYQFYTLYFVCMCTDMAAEVPVVVQFGSTWFI